MAAKKVTVKKPSKTAKRPAKIGRGQWGKASLLGGALVTAIALVGVVGVSTHAFAAKKPATPTAPAAVPHVATTLTVAKDGTGTYTTIQAAATAALPGDTVEIAAGTYQEAVKPASSGTAGAPITYKNRAGDKVIIDGKKSLYSTNGLVNLDGKSYINMSGISVLNSPKHAIYGYQVSNINLDQIEVGASSDGGIVFIGGTSGSNGNNVVISNSDIHNTNDKGTSAANEAISINNINGFEVKNNKVYNCGEEGIDAKYGATNGTIHDNQAYNNRGPNIYLDAATNTKVYNNIARNATNNTKAGIMLAVESYASVKKLDNIDIYNNQLINNQGSGIVFWKENSKYTISNVRIINNVMYGNSKNGINFASSGFTGTNVIRNNIMTGNTGTAIGGSTTGFTLSNNLTSGNPLYVNPTTGDFHLQPGSPAIDTGSAALAPAFDFAGSARPQGAGYDMGVYEQ